MKFESQLLKGVAPVVVLEILSGGQMYGYELSQAIEQRSGAGQVGDRRDRPKETILLHHQQRQR